jgi:chromatin segregation and condensation protein Rec8/ScpA/Scc1 (kleisin family)
MLELVRNGFIDANQDDNFQNIRLEKQEKIEPVYNKESSYE